MMILLFIEHANVFSGAKCVVNIESKRTIVKRMKFFGASVASFLLRKKTSSIYSGTVDEFGGKLHIDEDKLSEASKSTVILKPYGGLRWNLMILYMLDSPLVILQ